MKKKSYKDPNQKNNKLYASNSCNSTCSKCSGNCGKNTQHTGAHSCKSGHQW